MGFDMPPSTESRLARAAAGFASARLACALAGACLALLAVAALPGAAFAASVYTATATPSYAHPGTGAIEDSGGSDSQVLGTSMVESATDSAAFVEVDDAGNRYVTIRLKLQNMVSDIQFQVDNSWTGSFSPISADIVQEDTSAHSADFRMAVSDESAVFRCSMYVTPMGRNVVFYITLSNYVEGNSAGFVQLVTDSAAEEPVEESAEAAAVDTTALSQAVADARAIEQGDKTDEAYGALQAAIAAAEAVLAAPADQAAADEAVSALAAAVETFNASEDVIVVEEEGEEEEVASGVAAFDAEGNEIAEEESSGVPVALIVVGVAVVAAVAAVVAWRMRASRTSASAAAAAAAAQPAEDVQERSASAGEPAAAEAEPTAPLADPAAPTAPLPAAETASLDASAGDSAESTERTDGDGSGR